jgi:gamma-glutamyltranspeptidase/glutathione hydrolase
VDFEMSIEEAVKSPRVHWENHVFNVEPPLSISPQNLAQLNLTALTELILWKQHNMFFGGVHAVSKTHKGFEGVGDARREGFALI